MAIYGDGKHDNENCESTENSKPYPEHEKLSGINEQSQWLGSFIEWGQEQGWSFRQYDEETDNWYRIRKTIEQMLSEYFKIDLVKLEEEKVQMLKQLSEFQKNK